MKPWQNRFIFLCVSILLWSTAFFVQQTDAQTLSDEEWMKQRLWVIHARYTWAGDHDQFLFKLQQAKKNTTTPVVIEALDQIIVWREELRPEKTGWASSIPLSYTTQSVAHNKHVDDEEKEDVWNNTPTGTTTDVGANAWAVQDTAARLVTDDRYQLNDGFIDVWALQETRLWWVNELRVSRGRKTLMLNVLLDKTAADRSETMKKKWVADHKRFANSAYYAYGEIEQWFTDRWVMFVNVSRATFTENIWRSTFRCTQWDCTQEAVDAMRTTFDFYLREEGIKNDAHWRTLIHPLFWIVWLGIAVDEDARKFYLTTHYGTEIK